MESTIHQIPTTADHRPVAPGWLPVDAETVERVRAIGDPSVRNLWITQAYADLGHRLATILETDQTWCTFGVWASNTAGVSIRSAELPDIVERLLHGASDHVDASIEHARRVHPLLAPLDPFARFGRDHIARLVDTALDQVSARIAHGNTLVFSELAPLFVTFIERLEQQQPDDDVDGRLADLGDVDDPLVGQAFRSWSLAVAEPDDHTRAQLVLAGNIAAVLHEQQRLQDDIAAALDAGLLDARDELLRDLRWFIPRPLRRFVVEPAVERITPHLERLWEHVATHLLMTLAVPDALLHLGADVPAPEGSPLFPGSLDRIDLPVTVALMDEWDTTGGTGRGSGAGDWSVLHQRMGYIVNLFRSRQRHRVLDDPPFTQAQIDEMLEERLPADL